MRSSSAAARSAAWPSRCRTYAEFLRRPESYPEDTDRLSVLAIARWLRRAAFDPDCEALLDRIESVDDPPWAQLRDALVAVRES